jgi:hypothetical protein
MVADVPRTFEGCCRVYDVKHQKFKYEMCRYISIADGLFEKHDGPQNGIFQGQVILPA